MHDDVIIIKQTTTEESVKISELTYREVMIYRHGYNKGLDQGKRMWPGIASALVILIVTFTAFILFIKNFNP